MSAPHPAVYFVRHGQSTWNLECRVQGRSHEPPLTELGRQQASAAAATVQQIAPRHVISSDQVRAAQTAEIIAASCGRTVEYDERLREHDHGALTGMRSEDAIAAWDAVHQNQTFDPDVRQGGTGESVRDVAARFASLWADLASYDGPVVLVSHGALIGIAISVINGEDLADMSWHGAQNGDVLDGRGHLLGRSADGDRPAPE